VFAEPIKLIVPYPAGGFFDVYARLMQKVGKEKGYDIVVINRPGAEGVLGAYDIINEKSDNTIAIVSYAVFSYKALESEQLKKGILSLTPIVDVGKTTIVFYSNSKSKFQKWEDFEKVLKSSDNINIGTFSPAVKVVVNEIFGNRPNINYIPYNGEKPVITDILNGSLDIGTSTYPGTISLIKSGAINGLVITSGSNPYMPKLSELGYHDKIPEIISGLFMRPGASDVGKEKMKEIFTAILNSPEIMEYRKENDVEVPHISLKEAVEKKLK